MRRRNLIAVALAAPLALVLLLYTVPATMQTATGTATVTLNVNQFVEVKVVDGSIQITFQPSTSNAVAWFAVNTADFFNVTEGASNINVTLAVKDYNETLPSDYPSTLPKPLLLFHIGSTSSDYVGAYFNATINASSASFTPTLPNYVIINGLNLTLDSTITPVGYSIPLSSVAVYIDSNGNVNTYNSTEYLCLASGQYYNGSTTYILVFGKYDPNSCSDTDFTSADYAIVPTNASNDINDYILEITDANGYKASFRVYSFSEGNYVVLKPAVPLPYDGVETPNYIFVVVKLPVAAPSGSYSFNVTLETWSAEG